MFIRCIASLAFLFWGATLAAAFDLQGHRGARGLLPENTLPAFAKALEIGVTTLELDTGITKDGVVVISHDPALHPDLTRDAKDKWITSRPLIKDLTFAELAAFDVGRLKPGSRTAKRFPYQTSVDGTPIPSLEQLFQLVANSGTDKVRFNIETKITPTDPDVTVDPESFAKALVQLVAENELTDRVSIQSFDWRTLQIVQKIEPGIDTVYLTAQQRWLDNVQSSAGNASAWTAGFNLDDYQGSVSKMIKAAGGRTWSPFYRDLSASKVKQAQSLGLLVVPWTVNDEASMVELIEMGVDGIITDYPDILRKVMDQRSMQ